MHEPVHKIIVASGNRGKIAEINSVLAEQGVELVSKNQFNINDPEETGLSFIENAILKARYSSGLGGLPALADDSGLVVDSLDGRPGIYSSRYAGSDADDEQNVTKLLKDMEGFSDNKRSAYFYCAIAFVLHENDPTPVTAEARWNGQVAMSPSGSNGFGYDPIFYLSSQQCTAAALDSKLKNSLSHRAKALKKFSALAIDLKLFP